MGVSTATYPTLPHPVGLRTGWFLLWGTLPLLAVAAPMWQSAFGYPHGEGLYALLSPICHQFPTRSFWILDRPFALCARCTSGYLGVAAAALFVSLDRTYPKRVLLGLAMMLPGVTDAVVQLLTAHESNNLMRGITGFFGGVGVFLLVFPWIARRNRANQTGEG